MLCSARNKGGGRPSLELHLGQDVLCTGRSVSGVVVLRLDRPVNIRSLNVSVTGREKPAGASVARALRGIGSFFHRDVLLSGRDQPRLISDRASQLWNSLLGRDTGRCVSAGEHVYPFSILLPASLPPSYEGRAGRIDYRVSARVQFPSGRSVKAFAEVPVVLVPRIHRARPMAVSYPRTGGTVRSEQIAVELEVHQRTVELGGRITGHFAVTNPQEAEVPRITVSLEMCEFVRLAAQREMQRDRVGLAVVTPENPTAGRIEGDFELSVPKSASPSVEGTAISVIWLLKLAMETTPPVELKTPIVVYKPVPKN